MLDLHAFAREVTQWLGGDWDVQADPDGWDQRVTLTHQDGRSLLLRQEHRNSPRITIQGLLPVGDSGLPPRCRERPTIRVSAECGAQHAAAHILRRLMSSYQVDLEITRRHQEAFRVRAEQRAKAVAQVQETLPGSYVMPNEADETDTVIWFGEEACSGQIRFFRQGQAVDAEFHHLDLQRLLQILPQLTGSASS